jgi:hypothetical protein
MKIKLLLIAFVGFTLLTSDSFAQGHKCATMDILNKRIANDPAIKERMEAKEVLTQKWVSEHPKQKRGGSQIITIPVVFHVIWNDPIENISDNQIYSQLDILNEDFRLLNPDSLDDTHPFWPYTADSEIEFCLASVDENGNPTNGITRTQTSVTTWDDNILDDIKSTANGGYDNWDATQYLNIWVVNLDGGLLGFATLPDGLATDPFMDGVVIRYEAFGTIGTAGSGSFQVNGGGRTATHEVGHWLNLSHIWGDAICGDDFVSDTETAEDNNFGCPSFPHNDNSTCGSGVDGEMYMNYMDYVDDDCMNMFTAGQATRMHAALNGDRSGLLTSNGCGLFSAITNNFNEKSIELYPNPNNGNFTLNFKDSSIKNYAIDIFNVLGEKVKTLNIANINSTQINIGEFGVGAYYLQVTAENKTITKKVFVTK